VTVHDVRYILTPRLELRAVTPDDVRWHRLLDENPAVTATLGGPRTPEQTEARVLEQVGHWAEHGYGWWTVFERGTNELVGRGGLRHIVLEGLDEIEVSYALVPERWGRGLATELARAALDQAAGALGLRRVVGVTLPMNRASQRVLEKAGLTYARMTEHARLPHFLYVWSAPTA
jgi:[ribosomal protein S5]-alanine N-acetyltransferase